MKTLSIDIETYSSVDLAKCGVYKYTEAPDFDILLLGYSVDGSPVQVVDLACGETIPSEIIAALTDTSVTKVGVQCAVLSGYASHAGLGKMETLITPATASRRIPWEAISTLPPGNAP